MLAPGKPCVCAQLFPSRDRRNIKNKFNREEREQPSAVNEALTGRGMSAEDKRVLMDVVGVTPICERDTTCMSIRGPSDALRARVSVR